ncbi:hypothetical protein CRG98_018971 [Punica granatum]|uniref:Uncharacterized protein n=1 Tax=Punica granatum TaxID=22663 RepID=A0A2I0JWF8_PUNGR|nr:hypothetical protein CRG98_018971 [Punica granatum]
MAGKQVDLGIKLGRIDGPDKRKEGESSKKTTAVTFFAGGKNGKEAFVNAVNPGSQSAQQYPINFTPVPPATQVQQSRPPSLRAPQPAQQLPTQQVQRGDAMQTRQRRQFTPLPIPLSQDMIEKNEISFNAVKPPNVQTNPLPDHGSASGPTVNMIGAHLLQKNETKEE